MFPSILDPVCVCPVPVSVVKASDVDAHSAVITWKAPAVAFHSYRVTYQLAGGEAKVTTLP